MYPYRNRTRWFLFGRYSHLMRACRDRRRALQDTVLDGRLASLRTWNTVRFAVSLLLTGGLVATAVSAYANMLPGAASTVLVGFITISTALTGGLTVAYLFLTRLLGQLEIDILTILTLDHAK
ncbi:MAG: hypothetical protein ACYC2H_10610 [Thermoplasmatota archaeon]